ncbi:MAG: hypothetical protein U1F11_04695 [Steroidobacteraceae bacterium]
MMLLVATRKGAWVFHSDARRRARRCDGPHFLGQIVHHWRSIRATAARCWRPSTGHLGPTLFRSTDAADTAGSEAPAGLPQGDRGHGRARRVQHVLAHSGSREQAGRLVRRTSPAGKLFRTADGGDAWEPCAGLNDDPQYREWMGGPQDGTPDRPKLHSIASSTRAMRDTCTSACPAAGKGLRDGGRSWAPLIEGLEVVESIRPRSGSIRTACVSVRASRTGSTAESLRHLSHRPPVAALGASASACPSASATSAMVIHPTDADTAWVFPMDGSSVWPRVAIGRPAAYVTRNGGPQLAPAGPPACRPRELVDREAPGQ